MQALCTQLLLCTHRAVVGHKNLKGKGGRETLRTERGPEGWDRGAGLGVTGQMCERNLEDVKNSAKWILGREGAINYK